MFQNKKHWLFCYVKNQDGKDIEKFKVSLIEVKIAIKKSKYFRGNKGKK